MNRHLLLRRALVVSLLAMATTAGAALAQSPLGSPFGNEAGGYAPKVPVSAFARPWMDPTRLRISTSVSVGSNFSGGTSGLQVTSFAYQFTRPAWLEVSVGNAFGKSGLRGNGMFLEGLRFGFKPTANTVFQIQYHDLRSPLQQYYSRDPFFARDPYYGGW